MTRFIFLFLAVFSCAAFAQEDAPRNGFYAAISSGNVSSKAQSDRGVRDSAIGTGGGTQIISNEYSDNAPVIFSAGYKFSPYFGLEAGRANFGELHYYTANFKQGVNNGSSVAVWEATGWQIAGKGFWPLPYGFAAVGQLSAYRLDTKFRTETTVRDPATLAIVSSNKSNTSGSGTVPAIGLGLTYELSPAFIVRTMYERLADKSGLFGAGNDLKGITLLTFGAELHF